MSIGRRAGKYHLVTPLGQGGMGLITLGLALGPGDYFQCVVIKSLRPEYAHDEDFVAMFDDEARLAARLQHPNVVRALGVEDAPDGRFLVLEYLEGQSLGALCERVGHASMPLGLHLLALSEVLAGLHYAHELADYDGTPIGIVHRDISPHNVFVTYDGQVKVLDFGVAKAAKNRSRTRVGTLKGKLSYMAPEQAVAAFDGNQAVDRRADVFAVGVMLWEALAGRWRTVDGLVGEAVLAGRLTGEEPSLRTVRPDVDPALAAVCDRATALDPAQRYPTALAFRQALLAALERLGGPASAEALGALVSGSFADDRRRLRDLVRGEIDRARAAAAPASVAGSSVAPPTGPFAGVPAWAAMPVAGPGEQPSVVPVARPSVKLDPSPSVGGTLASPPRSPRAFGLGVIAAALALSGGIALAVVVGLSSRHQAASPPGATSSALPLVASAPAASAAARVQLSAVATPAGAKLFLDDRPLAANPFLGSFERDGQRHRLRAKLAGRDDAEREISFDQDADLHVELSLNKSSSVEHPPASAHPTGRTPARTAKPRGDGARPRSLAIDEAAPF
ncbi:MAG: serine/threonine protein kinase [Polyangiaceae bacterium]|nr:serine/threonine protein kinase [Polyangiaceae bacterium]